MLTAHKIQFSRDFYDDPILLVHWSRQKYPSRDDQPAVTSSFAFMQLEQGDVKILSPLAHVRSDTFEAVILDDEEIGAVLGAASSAAAKRYEW
jgi:hypothetical protein